MVNTRDAEATIHVNVNYPWRSTKLKQGAKPVTAKPRLKRTVPEEGQEGQFGDEWSMPLINVESFSNIILSFLLHPPTYQLFLAFTPQSLLQSTSATFTHLYLYSISNFCDRVRFLPTCIFRLSSLLLLPLWPASRLQRLQLVCWLPSCTKDSAVNA
jgi:hypothetical protein